MDNPVEQLKGELVMTHREALDKFTREVNKKEQTVFSGDVGAETALRACGALVEKLLKQVEHDQTFTGG